MNVLGKIKSKKLKILEENSSQPLRQNQLQPRIQENKQLNKIQQSQQYQEMQVMIKHDNIPQENHIYQTQKDSYIKKVQETVQKKNQKKYIKTPQSFEYISNNNVLTKQKQISIRQKYTTIDQRFNSSSNSNNFSNYFHTKKQSKKSGIYFQGNPSMRQNSLFTNPSSKQKTSLQTVSNNDESEETDEQFSLNFEFLLSNKEKKDVKKSLHMSKGKVQNIKQIQQELILENAEVICFFVKKWHTYSDIYMFQGELQSLKRRFIEVQDSGKPRKIYDRIKVKISCPKDILTLPESIGRIYVSQVVFVSLNQGMIIHQFLLKTIQKSRRFKK